MTGGDIWLLTSAKAALSQGRLADAADLLSRVPPSEIGSAELNLTLGVALGKQGDHSGASIALQRCLTAKPDSIEALNYLTIVFRQSGDVDSARDTINRALALEPGNPQSLCNLGLVHLQSFEYEDAIRVLGCAVDAHPKEALFRHNLALALQGMGRYSEAAKQYQAAIALSDSALSSHIGLGGMMLTFGKAEAALECARTVLRRDPKSVAAHLLAARAFLNLDQGDRSEWHLREVLKLDPSNSGAWGMLGFRLQAKGEFPAADQAFRRSLQLNPNQGVGYWGLRQGNKATEDDLREADHLLELSRSKALDPGETSFAYFAVAKTYADLGRHREAMRFYDLANGFMADSHFGQGRFDRAAYERGMEQTRTLFTRRFIEANSGVGCESSTPIFIVGMMRSGTTLMEQILSSTSEVADGGELRFWLDRGPKVVDPKTASVVLPMANSLISDYLDLLRRISSRAHVTDKMPDNYQMLGLIHILFPKAKILYMKRNAVDVALSIYMTPYEISPAFAHVKENIVFGYKKHQELMSHWKTVLPHGSFLEVRYEDLIDQSESTIRRVVDYCGLSWDDAFLRHSDNTRTVNTPSVWQVRQPIYATSRGKWKLYEPFLGAFADLLGE